MGFSRIKTAERLCRLFAMERDQPIGQNSQTKYTYIIGNHSRAQINHINIDIGAGNIVSLAVVLFVLISVAAIQRHATYVCVCVYLKAISIS